MHVGRFHHQKNNLRKLDLTSTSIVFIVVMLVLMELLEDVSTPRVLPPLQFMCLSVGDDIVRDVMFNGWMLEITLLNSHFKYISGL
jgi:hypothetical protein